MEKIMKNERIKYLLLFLLFLGIEVLIALFVHDDWIRPYLGDVIVIWVLYFFLRIFIRKRYRLLPIFLFLFAMMVELMQKVDVLSVLGLKDNPVLRIVFGTVFDIKDIICYGIGALLLMIFLYFRFDKKVC